MVKREMYLKRIRPFYDSELIKVISGIRRCGKSTLLRQIMEEIGERGIEKSHIIAINFEDFKYRKLFQAEAFYEYVEKRISEDGKYYLFFDEIQNVHEFEVVVNSFRATHDVSIFMTGSNSKLLSGELATHLGGRTISFSVLPFCFREFCELHPSEGREEQFLQYIKWGGFPMVGAVDGEEEKEVILSNLYDSVVLKDIIMRNKIASPQMLDRILEYVIANSSTVISGNNVAAALTDANQKVSAPTVYDYLRYIEEACIVNHVERYDIRGKKALAFEEKIYVCDLGFFHLKKNRCKDEFGYLVETIVHNELLARGYHIYIGKTYRGEIDFIAERNSKRIYIQATYLLADEKTIEREFGAYADVADNYPKYVISMDHITADREGIIHLNLLDFLLDESLIE